MEIRRYDTINGITRMWANAQGDGRPAEYRWRRLLKVCLTPTTRVPFSNAANIGERKTWGRKLNFAPGKILFRGKSPRKCIYSVPAQETAKHRAVLLASVERRRCSNEVKTQHLLKFAGVSRTTETISAANGSKFTIL